MSPRARRDERRARVAPFHGGEAARESDAERIEEMERGDVARIIILFARKMIPRRI